MFGWHLFYIFICCSNSGYYFLSSDLFKSVGCFYVLLLLTIASNLCVGVSIFGLSRQLSTPFSIPLVSLSGAQMVLLLSLSYITEASQSWFFFQCLYLWRYMLLFQQSIKRCFIAKIWFSF